MTTVKSRWASSCKTLFPAFKEDAENKEAIKMVMLWMARDERFEQLKETFSLNKGILLLGSYGGGKTLLMELVQRTLYLLRSEYMFKRQNMRELCQKYQAAGSTALQPENRHLFVDEFGLLGNSDERERVNSYGNKIVVGDELIGIRYDLFRAGHLTHLTTNLTYNQISEYYSPRTVSRLHEMFNFIPLTGTDRRLTAKPQPRVQEEENTVDKKEVARQWWRMIIREHAAYKNSGKLLVMGAISQIKFFEEAGLLVLSTKEKLQWIEKAKLAIATENVEAKLKYQNKAIYNRIVSLKDAIAKNSFNLEQDTEVKSKAIQMLIADFYSSKTEEEFQLLVNGIIERI